MTVIVGLNLSHDSAAAIVVDGQVREALALERTTGVKRGVVAHHAYAAAMARLIDTVLADQGLGRQDVDHWIATSTETRSQGEEDGLLASLGLLTDPASALALPHPGHHLAHASAAFYCSAEDRPAAALVIDAYGSRIGPTAREQETAFLFQPAEEPRLLWRTVRPSSRIAGRRRDGDLWIPSDLSGIGEVYRAVTLALGFAERGSTYDDAGKTMGLASYGKPLSKESLFIQVDGGRIRFDGAADHLADLGFATRTTDGYLLRTSESAGAFDQQHFDLAAQLQHEFEAACLALAARTMREAGTRRLVLAGGCFLNSALNTRIAAELQPEDLFVFPAATDDGNAVGAALYADRVLLGRATPTSASRMTHVYLGPSQVTGQRDTIQALAQKTGLEPVTHADERSSAEAAAAAVARGEIIGWFQDRAELGPRALGARSILCHPGITGMKDRLNARVKFREGFRPFAASVLQEQALTWFDLPCPDSPFMLLVCPVRPDLAPQVQEITHVDGTCRLQTVATDLPGGFRLLIEEFARLTGIPMVLNTSFNVRGKPIVEDPAEAIDCLFGSQLDRLFIGTIEIPAPDRLELRPVRMPAACTVGLDPDEALLLDLATGEYRLRETAERLGWKPDRAVTMALDLRRRGLLGWDAIPVYTARELPMAQYDPHHGG
ncbi:carbamoyltransferase C-terminal domain-containing protein [Streptomyces sp. 5.8]|uniref:carbamoyltransferase C-terminal domain-containing protein n=1 Tax=Streptomyces sp. 5.8 TaxID=3406571 RepID=UPI003BB7CA9F